MANSVSLQNFKIDLNIFSDVHVQASIKLSKALEYNNTIIT